MSNPIGIKSAETVNPFSRAADIGNISKLVGMGNLGGPPLKDMSAADRGLMSVVRGSALAYAPTSGLGKLSPKELEQVVRRLSAAIAKLDKALGIPGEHKGPKAPQEHKGAHGPEDHKKYRHLDPNDGKTGTSAQADSSSSSGIDQPPSIDPIGTTLEDGARLIGAMMILLGGSYRQNATDNVVDALKEQAGNSRAQAAKGHELASDMRSNAVVVLVLSACSAAVTAACAIAAYNATTGGLGEAKGITADGAASPGGITADTRSAADAARTAGEAKGTLLGSLGKAGSQAIDAGGGMINSTNQANIKDGEAVALLLQSLAQGQGARLEQARSLVSEMKDFLKAIADFANQGRMAVVEQMRAIQKG